MRIIAIVILLGLFIWPVFILPFTGLHIQIGEGSQSGYITAVEKTGIFFKTWTAYVKSDLSSSQEDKYCVVGDDVAEELKETSKKGERVTVRYIDWLVKGFANCNGESDVIVR